jgi:beta-alanine--pyruvate transaminase
MLRITADTIALTPPLIISDNQIDELIEKVKKCILAVA